MYAMAWPCVWVRVSGRVCKEGKQKNTRRLEAGAALFGRCAAACLVC